MSKFLFLSLFATVLVVVFRDALFSGEMLFSSPDGFPLFKESYRSMMFERMYAPWVSRMLGDSARVNSFRVLSLLAALLPPAVYQTAFYMLNTLLLGLAGMFLVKSLKISGIPLIAAGIAMAFQGYAFTLITAGHRGVFDMMPFVVLMFGCVIRGIKERSVFYIAMCGVCAAIAVNSQADVAVLFVFQAAILAVILTIFEIRKKERMSNLLKTYFSGGVLAIVFAVSLSLSTVDWLFTTKIEERAQVSGPTAESQWEFATNWSMPPEEIIEFVAPGIFGIETSDVDAPYWGRLGRSMGWAPDGPGLINLKQHTLYVGVIQLVFAVYALVWAVFRVRKKKSQKEFTDNGDIKASELPHSTNDTHVFNADLRKHVFFWSSSFVLAVILAMGRYTFVYRLFYMLPMMSRIRAPVKFMHLAEVAACVLMAIGFYLFATDLSKSADFSISAEKQKLKRRTAEQKTGMSRVFGLFGIGTLICSVFMFVAALLVKSFLPAFSSYWASFGSAHWGRFGLANNFADVLMTRMTGSLYHGAVLFLVIAAIFGCSRYWCRSKKAVILYSVVVLLVLAVDVSIVAGRYVKTRDMSWYYSSNAVADYIAQQDELGRLSYRLSELSKFNPLWGNFFHHEVDIIDPPQLESPMSELYRMFFSTLQNHPLRLWQLTNTRYITGRADDRGLMQLANYPFVHGPQYFSIGPRGIHRSDEQNAQIILLENRAALPRAIVFHKWLSVDEQDALRMLASEKWEPTGTVLVEGDLPRPDQTGTSSAHIVEYGRSRIKINVDITDPGVLLLNDKYDPDWIVRVNGRKDDLLKCNYIMRGVFLPPGKHTVVFSYRPYLVPFLLSLTAALIVVAWIIFRCVGSSRKKR